MHKTNIVQEVCDKLNINQATLAKKLDVGTSTVSEWKKGNIPKMAELALKLMLESREQQKKLQKIKEAFSIIQKIG